MTEAVEAPGRRGAGTGGTQVVHRAAQLLRAIAGREEGATVAGLAAATGLTRPTVHRLLTGLAAEGLVERSAASGAWQLGPELYVLGAVAAHRYPIRELAAPSLRRLAEATGESAFLSARRGLETVCLARVEGAFPIRSHVLYEGLRLPLGVASAGLAILAHLPEAEVERVLDATAGARAQWGPLHVPERIRPLLVEVRRRGVAVNPGMIVEGSWGMGAAVFDATGAPAYALSLTGIEPRFAGERRELLGRALLAEAHRLSRELGHR
ncbi:IclR family transcriptional regulator [Kocuria flava]|uniref:IclR family transcriptional regulator n=1 Tax=Kocuria flava TaxID=446860 RepID=A0A0U2XJJ1_9MICC|nr:IclR family transcriptional regulator [Kocuria flava]ALU38530.1 IclR family transcriptional regulator [Kocuria flava]GEO92797.1 putative IclR-family regulatory protein [Kocuria flava]